MWLPKGKQFQPLQPILFKAEHRDVIYCDGIWASPAEAQNVESCRGTIGNFLFPERVVRLKLNNACNMSRSARNKVTTLLIIKPVAGEVCNWWIHKCPAQFFWIWWAWVSVLSGLYMTLLMPLTAVNKGVQFQGVWGHDTWVGWRQMSWWICLKKWNT